mmetsp:Transcript_23377/g.36197  ORF Transcript_23377/g.36197 Transcript_23377/m.36197 type:complete len:258 (+) Transcript_23377:2909-3682(+)
MVNSSDSNHGRNVGCSIQLGLVGRLITQNQYLNTVAHVLNSLVTDGFNRILNSVRTISKRISSRNSSLLETSILWLGKGSNPVHFVGVQYGRFKVNEAGTLLRNLVDTLFLSECHSHRHNNTLTKRIDRRVGYLSETLLEVIVRCVWAFGENGNWSIISHRVSCLLSRSSHVLDLHTNILKSPSESSLSEGGGGIIIKTVIGEGHLCHVLASLFDPFAVGVTRSDFGLDSNIVLEFTSCQINIDHLTRSKTSLLNNI